MAVEARRKRESSRKLAPLTAGHEKEDRRIAGAPGVVTLPLPPLPHDEILASSRHNGRVRYYYVKVSLKN